MNKRPLVVLKSILSADDTDVGTVLSVAADSARVVTSKGVKSLPYSIPVKIGDPVNIVNGTIISKVGSEDVPTYYV